MATDGDDKSSGSDSDSDDRPPRPSARVARIPKGAVQLEPGVYVMREVRSAFVARSAKPVKPPKARTP